MKIIIDTREKLYYTFEKYECEVESGSLVTGDYSLSGLTDKIAVERKSINDLIGCLTNGRERFERELTRGRGLDSFTVAIEATWADVCNGRYHSKMKSHSACQSILTFQLRYHVPFFFCGDRTGAEYATYWIMQKYVTEQQKMLNNLKKLL